MSHASLSLRVLCLLLSVAVAVPLTIHAQSAAVPPAAGSKSAASGAKLPAENEPDLVAVMDLDAVGATKAEASAITDRLREQLLKSGRFTLVDRTQMSAVLDEQALQQTGCTSQECAVQVGKVLGVRKLITGKVTKISDKQWLVNVTMTDVETSQTLRAEALPYEGTYFSLLTDGIVQLATRLSTPTGQKPDMAKYLAEQQQVQPPAPTEAKKPEEPQKSSSSKWWWIAGGVLLLAAAAGGGKGGGGGGGGGGGSGSSCSGCGTIPVSW